MQAGSVKLPADVACLDCTPLASSDKATLAAVGTWTMQLHLYLLPSLEPIAQVLFSCPPLNVHSTGSPRKSQGHESAAAAPVPSAQLGAHRTGADILPPCHIQHADHMHANRLQDSGSTAEAPAAPRSSLMRRADWAACSLHALDLGSGGAVLLHPDTCGSMYMRE